MSLKDGLFKFKLLLFWVASFIFNLFVPLLEIKQYVDKRYLIFGWGYKQTNGGLDDMIGSEDDLTVAMATAVSAGFENIAVYDRVAVKRIDLQEYGYGNAQ